MNASVSRRHALSLIACAPMVLCRHATAATHPIDESGFVPIGGIDQWLSIRGSNLQNPVILYLHGGPAEAQSPFLKQFLPWEADFTVVNWDQRGSGKTYGRNGPTTPGMSTPEMALDQMAEDVRQIVEHLRGRLGKKKVILVGQSWGTLLGLRVVKKWPQLFHAFAGTGFFVSWSQSLQGQARWTRQQAAAVNDQAALKELDDTASLPETDMKRIIAANKYRWAPSDLEYLKIQQEFVGPPPPPTRGDVADWLAGSGFSIPKLLPIVFSYDARKTGLEIPVPFFVIQGRDDHVTDFAVAKAYVEEIRAPVKVFIPISGGHFACFTDSAGFVGALRRNVRPVVRSQVSGIDP